jgi:hypothetical protein
MGRIFDMRVRVTFTEIEGWPEVEFDIPEGCESIADAERKRDESGAEGWDAVAVFERAIADYLADGIKVEVIPDKKLYVSEPLKKGGAADV